MGHRQVTHDSRLYHFCVLRNGARLPRWLDARYRNAAKECLGREAIILSAVPSGFFGILFGLRYGVVSQDAGSTLIASTILSAATVPAAILLTAGTH
jgi:hypothetical protein